MTLGRNKLSLTLFRHLPRPACQLSIKGKNSRGHHAGLRRASCEGERTSSCREGEGRCGVGASEGSESLRGSSCCSSSSFLWVELVVGFVLEGDTSGCNTIPNSANLASPSLQRIPVSAIMISLIIQRRVTFEREYGVLLGTSPPPMSFERKGKVNMRKRRGKRWRWDEPE